MSFFDRLKAEASAEWRAFTEHPFTNGMADGTLPEAAFRHYLVQDYLFLIEFARAYALSVYKSPTLDDMREAAAGLSAILDVEMDLHVKLCAGWGLSPTDLEQAPPTAEMLAYTRYVLEAGMRGDLLALKVALAPVSSATPRSRHGSQRDRTRLLQRTHTGFGSQSMPVQRTRRLQPRRGLIWTVSQISTPPLLARWNWVRFSGKRPNSRPTFGKWLG